jgi:hypothetical protein
MKINKNCLSLFLLLFVFAYAQASNKGSYQLLQNFEVLESNSDNIQSQHMDRDYNSDEKNLISGKTLEHLMLEAYAKNSMLARKIKEQITPEMNQSSSRFYYLSSASKFSSSSSGDCCCGSTPSNLHLLRCIEKDNKAMEKFLSEGEIFHDEAGYKNKWG